MRLPEEPAAVEAVEAALRADPARAEAQAEANRLECLQRGIGVMTGHGWPLRPFLVKRSLLEAIAKGWHERLLALRDALLQRWHGDRAAWLASLPIEATFFERFDLEEALTSPDFDWIARPDGFLFENRYVISEPNYGNGWMITLAETDLLYAHLSTMPSCSVLAELGRFDRPFVTVAESLRPDTGSSLGLLFNPTEYDALFRPEEPFYPQMILARHLWHELGLPTRWFFDDGSPIPGIASQSEAPVGRWAYLGMGQVYLEPGRSSDLRVDLGGRPLHQPIAGTLIQKGLMPLWCSLSGWPAAQSGVVVEVPATFAPGLTPGSPSRDELLAQRERWVIQRAFTRQRNVIGAASGPGTWARAVAGAWGSSDWIVQQYVRLPRATLPVVEDGRLRHVEVVVEISPFILKGRFIGALARYAPAEEGVVLSPTPQGLGINIVFAVDG